MGTASQSVQSKKEAPKAFFPSRMAKDQCPQARLDVGDSDKGTTVQSKVVQGLTGPSPI